MSSKIINGLRYFALLFNQAFKKSVIRIFCANIRISRNTFIGKGVQLKALKGSLIDIRDVYIKDYAYIYADINATIIIGAKSQVGMFNVLVAKEKISIGAQTLLAEFVTIRDQDHDLYNFDKFKVIPVEIGDNVWIAGKVTITKGVEIGSKSIIGANSVVTKSIPPASVAVGSPARVIKTL